MIEHLRGRERALEPLGWKGREAEWIALVCLHSGVFIRAQFCCYFNTYRKQAHRFVKALIDRKAAVESEWPVVNGGGKSCRISMAFCKARSVESVSSSSSPFRFMPVTDNQTGLHSLKSSNLACSCLPFSSISSSDIVLDGGS